MKKGKIESIGVGKKMHTSNQLKERLLKSDKCQCRNNSNGITLIALIITIIVVVILAGVAISMTVRK